jgi:hypothetical protein
LEVLAQAGADKINVHLLFQGIHPIGLAGETNGGL